MKKLSEKIHHQFVTGKINSAVYDYMQKVAADTTDAEVTLFDSHIKNLAAWSAKTEQDCKDYFYIYTHVPKVFEKLTSLPVTADVEKVLCKYAFLNRNQYNFSKSHHFSKLALDFYKEAKDKLAYPNNMGIESGGPLKQYNVDKWIETMRYIYDASNTNNLPLDSVTKQVTAKWEEDERLHFQRWMRYYQEGNYNKYNVKTAQLFMNKVEEGKLPDLKPVKDLFDTSAFPKPDPNAAKKQRLDEARTKLRSRLVSVEQLVEKYRDVLPKEISALIRKDVYDLKEKVYNLELKASIVDSINRTSNQLTKRGFVEGAAELKKIAQEVAQDALPAVTPEGPIEIPAPNAEIAPETPKAPSGDKDNIRVPEVSIGEETIEIPDFSSATHRDALQKLEEINKVISERNVVRALAAVDIILGQLGIASYFPQLSEAQSKLMDAFNYAGTRVAETIGQMRGGSGGPVAATPPAKPKEDQIEVAEEAEKPVGEVVSGGPPAEAPAPKAPVK